MCPPGYHHNSFLATYALRQIRYGYTLMEPTIVQQVKQAVQ